MMRWEKSASLLTALVVCAMGLAACRHRPDEVQVREAIATMATAAEVGAASDVVAPLSDDFDGNAGELDRRSLGNLIRLFALRGEHVGVTLGPVGIEHRGIRIVAIFTVTLTSGSHLLPDQLGVYRVESAWRNENGKWQCYSARWSRAI